MLGAVGETWIITRSNNRSAIEQAYSNDMVESVRFVYVDLPARWRRWKQGQRGIRLYYLLWQHAALREARRLARDTPFDLAWHLTLANAWLGCCAGLLGVPFIYGPIGGGVSMRWRLASTLGVTGLIYETARAAARMAGRGFNPLARSSWRRASLILVQNDETKHWIPRRHRAKVEVLPNTVLQSLPRVTARNNGNVLLFAGRLVPLKGVTLAILALEKLPDWRLIVCGDGPDRKRLERLAAERRLSDRIEFRGWVDRSEVLRAMRDEASVFVFPSLHDEAGWVVVEALASGLPVVCLDIGGPPQLAGRDMAVPPGSVAVTVERIAQSVIGASTMDRTLVQKRAREFVIGEKLTQLRGILESRGFIGNDRE